MWIFVCLVCVLLAVVMAEITFQYDGKKAHCPVLLVDLSITNTTTHLAFDGGQKLFFGSEDAKSAYMANPRAYWMSPYDMPNMDQMNGFPDVTGSTFLCPFSKESMNIGMQTPRVFHRSGQAIYFCCFGCVQKFWYEPESIFSEQIGRST